MLKAIDVLFFVVLSLLGGLFGSWMNGMFPHSLAGTDRALVTLVTLGTMLGAFAIGVIGAKLYLVFVISKRGI